MADHKVFKVPLLQKIGVQEGMKLATIGAPKWIIDEFEKRNYLPDIDNLFSAEYSLIWIFENTIKGMQSKLKKAKNHIHKDGIIWVSWYKKASKKSTQLNENIIRDTALALELVDVKVASVDDDWSALKMVVPLSKR